MNKTSLCLFGGALLGAGLSSPAVAVPDITINDTIEFVGLPYTGSYGGYVHYAFGLGEVDTFDFSVYSDGIVIFDMLSFDIFDAFLDDSEIALFINDGNPLSSTNFVYLNDDFNGDDLNGSWSNRDSFIEIFLTAGDYTIAVGSHSFTPSEAEVGESSSSAQSWFSQAVVAGGGQYQLDITFPPPVCQVDLNGDGSLDFFDVSAFLTAFGQQDSLADFSGDGSFDFFDVSAFLTAFGAGCP